MMIMNTFIKVDLCRLLLLTEWYVEGGFVGLRFLFQDIRVSWRFLYKIPPCSNHKNSEVYTREVKKMLGC